MKIKIITSFVLLFIFPFGGITNDYTKFNLGKNNNDTTKVVYELNCVFCWGGESKLALMLPKFNLIRKHKFEIINPYYGLELGLHGGFVAGYGSISGMAGIERNILSLETSLSHFRTTTIKKDDNVTNGPFSQNLMTLKLGIRMKKVTIKFDRSFLLSENIPNGQERIPLLDIGKINNGIWGIELQINLK